MTESIFNDFTQSESRVRSLTLENGNKYNIKQVDPYGFWEIHMESGQIPEQLSGKYTEFEKAAQAVQSYLATKKKTAKIDKE